MELVLKIFSLPASILYRLSPFIKTVFYHVTKSLTIDKFLMYFLGIIENVGHLKSPVFFLRFFFSINVN